MTSGAKTGLIIGGILLLFVLWLISAYNKLVKEEERTTQAWAQVENAYQRRADLIPNLVKTVKGAADFEKGTLESVIQARAEATSVKIDPTNLNEASIEAFEKAQNGLSASLGRLLMVMENYPELKATENFKELQAQLEGTENRISVERKKFNECVQAYNLKVRRFPSNLIAGIFGFEKKGYFKATEGAEKAPEVDFEF
ncbi:MAG: LemA family protein [Bacteroidales bacterium]|nr:LemA family protein [Bacteroidales bacterium]MBQ5532251.1 LemA family protein [Bacteroidales bacterium]MBR4340122.1 LemA family protein [Bacteroidales bacterium]MBR4512099.1 LemA family protein [Bacteroidales bacterium]MBR6918760.1 LemA family protein [Bacteroidales bacterium]